jgi:hypothetical protein
MTDKTLAELRGDPATWTDKQIEEFLATMKLPKLVRIKKPPKPEPVVKLATDRKLSVEGQRERVTNEVKELAVAERTSAEQQKEVLDPREYHRLKRERERQAGLYYRGLYEAVTTAEYYAKLNDVDHGNYSPITLFEKQMRNEND